MTARSLRVGDKFFWPVIGKVVTVDVVGYDSHGGGWDSGNLRVAAFLRWEPGRQSTVASFPADAELEAA